MLRKKPSVLYLVRDAPAGPRGSLKGRSPPPRLDDSRPPRVELQERARHGSRRSPAALPPIAAGAYPISPRDPEADGGKRLALFPMLEPKRAAKRLARRSGAFYQLVAYHRSRKIRQRDDRDNRNMRVLMAAVIRPTSNCLVANGAGKSTLVSLILALHRPWSGALFADGLSYEEIDISALRRRIGVVLQDPLTLPGTVAENIAYVRSNASEAEIRTASERATAADCIGRLDGGYEAIVGDDGLLLSGGERQRLSIARALIAQPRLLILDEPTTHLDESAIAALHANLAEMPEQPGTLTITHDRTTASRADRVVVLEHGQLTGGALGTARAALAGGW